MKDRQRYTKHTGFSNLVTTLKAVVETNAAEQRDERAIICVESIVKAAAAEPDSGIFVVPLSADGVKAMQKRQCSI